MKTLRLLVLYNLSHQPGGGHEHDEALPQAALAALRAGFSACYVLADAWFGCKENIACCLDQNLVGIFQMKRGLLAYRYHGRAYTASQLSAIVQRPLP